MDKTLIYVQSTYGIGHLMRMLSLAQIIGNVTIAYGGPIPKGLRIPSETEIIRLQEITDETHNPEEILKSRERTIKNIFYHASPENLIIEHFPFGRKKFISEIDLLLDLAKEKNTQCISSFRGALTGRENKGWIQEQIKRFDMLLVHNEEKECNVARELELPKEKVFHTGYLPPHDLADIHPPEKVKKNLGTKQLIVVSAGGGRDGLENLKPILQDLKGKDTLVLISAGPFMKEEDYQELKDIDSRFKVTRFNPTFLSYLNAADLSISMAGYNTISALMYTGTNAVVIPRNTDNEQITRARYFETTTSIEDARPLPKPKKRYMALQGLLKEKGPVEVKISIIRDCNNRCIMCGHWQDPKRKEKIITLENFKRLVNDLKELGIKKVRITGGEPLLHPDLFEMIRSVKEQDLFIEICTNGILVTEEMAKKLVSAGVDQVSISLDAGDESLHDRIRGNKGAFERSVQAFRHLRKHDSFLKLHCNTVIMNENYRNLDKLVELAEDIGISHITLAPLKMYISQLEKLKLTKEQQEEFYFKIYPSLKEKARQVRINVTPILIEGDTDQQLKAFTEELFGEYIYNRYYCFKPLRRFDIKSDGSVLPCCGLLDDDLIMGNINQQSIIDIWNSEKYRQYRLSTKIPRHEQCRYCATYQHQNLRDNRATRDN
ncbi:MAG: radical SAM protein [Candidatus Woesearchaeota archaeon]